MQTLMIIKRIMAGACPVFKRESKMIVIRRTIQHEFLRLLVEAGFLFDPNDAEPRGLQRRVMEAVNKQ